MKFCNVCVNFLLDIFLMLVVFKNICFMIKIFMGFICVLVNFLLFRGFFDCFFLEMIKYIYCILKCFFYDMVYFKWC